MIRIEGNHPTLQLKDKVQEICTHFLAQHGFNYFQYLRCNKDGSCSLLTNETGLFESFSQMPAIPLIYSSYTEEHEKLHSYWFLWDEELPAFPVNFAREKFNLHHGLTLVRRAKDYYDMIAVALPEPRRNITSFYLTKHKIIEQFINRFDKTQHDLILHINKNPLVLPTPNRDENYRKMCLSHGRIEILGRHGAFYITARELTCLRLLLQGATSKEIAQVLHLSHRTVETYFNRIKLRSGVVSRAGLADLISICP